jgi:ferredoxin-thioredoxin reductase catalytic chain
MELIEIQTHIIKTAEDKSWNIQTDTKMLTALTENMKSRARGKIVICPCKTFVEGFMPIESVACPCPEASDDIEKFGKCHCRLFFKKE